MRCPRHGSEMSNPVHVLVVDDEPRIRTMLRRYLVEEGFKVSDAADGSAMRAALEGDAIHLVLLDLMMPGEDGLSLARYIRQRSEIPIIMLTGKGDLIDRVVGLEAGADDYITKPFELREVLARIRTVHAPGSPAPRARHSRPRPPPAAPRTRSSSFRAGGSTWCGASSHGPTGELVPLTAGEFDLLCAFAHHPNRVLSREQLIELVKGRGLGGL